MPEFVIEKEIRGLGDQSPFQQEQTVRRSCSTLHGISPDIAWVKSYLTQDKCYCVFRAPSAEALQELIRQMDLPPVISICEVKQVVGP
jgi:hypothetical protein